ncbi:sugar phosphate isomerase/epimerase [Tepidanaerobacter sp. GT38]|uniref:TIM barrel protein n=1 Tax=Tepidanaerobacter sp. GT38 TaxID=2722793 RepID=UPI001F235877|nr:TIM barrel protein [Tepidanaerobacter sp. GT38]MCG1012835.1 sugar phosphate isomerase/epimerase [Tepidanaerobacter sp. GT38]
MRLQVAKELNAKVIVGSIKMARAALGHVHFADSNRWYPGAGHLDFEAIISVLKEINYSGVIAFECLPLPTQEEAAVKGLEHVSNTYNDI